MRKANVNALPVDVALGIPSLDAGSVMANARFPKYDIGGGCPGKPAISQKVLIFKCTQAFTLAAGLTNSQAFAGTAAAGSSVFTIEKNGVALTGGTLTWAATGTVPTLALTSQASFAVGDRLTITAPGTQDATLADIGITLQGLLT